MYVLYLVAKCCLGANPNLMNSSKGAGLEKKRLQLIFNLTTVLILPYDVHLM